MIKYPISFYEFAQNLDLIRNEAMSSAEIVSLQDVGDREGKAFRQITVETKKLGLLVKTLPVEVLDPALSVGDRVSIVGNTAEFFLFFPGPIFVQNTRNEAIFAQPS